MIEFFAGGAVLTSVAKHFGMKSSIAVAKSRKQGARASVVQIDLTTREGKELVDAWLMSPLLVWVHLAPACGTARDIRCGPSAPRPLRSNDFPHGLLDLSGIELTRVLLANDLFHYSCTVFAKACRRGLLVTLENPRSSFFWVTDYFLRLLKEFPLYFTNFQVRMLGGSRDKWSRIVANFAEIEQMDIECDKSHPHAPWGFAFDDSGKTVSAVSLEAQYPRKLCVALVQTALQCLHRQGVILLPTSLADLHQHPLHSAHMAQISVGKQPRGAKLPPMMPDFQATATFAIPHPSYVPCALLSKLAAPLQLWTIEGSPVEVPAHARLLRSFLALDPSQGGVCGDQEKDESASLETLRPKRVRTSVSSEPNLELPFRAVFGLPWSCENFIKRACELGHPAELSAGIPEDLEHVLDVFTTWSDAQIAGYRRDWCRKWLKRATELENAEKLDWESRPEHVRANTKGKRLLLCQEMLQDVSYGDMEVLDLVRHGSTLAGDIPPSPIFSAQYRPCLQTVEQLKASASKRNQAVIGMTRSSGERSLDAQVLTETREEVGRGWAVGPFDVSALPSGSVISRRFPLAQGAKTRMIDDFSVSGVNDSCTSHTKIDLHMIDTLGAVMQKLFSLAESTGRPRKMMAKTFDLKSAYRQVPIKEDHLAFAYFSIFNHEKQGPEVYQLRTLPFGAVHSVYSFLRLARMIHTLAARGLKLLNTNFYDDFILVSPVENCNSANNAMEVLFMILGWDYAREGKKATSFDIVCRALGIEFNLSRSDEGLMTMCNTEQRRQDLLALLDHAISNRALGKQETLVLRGKLGFADSFLHGRLGSLVLKKLSEHAYSGQSSLDTDVLVALHFMKKRLKLGLPKTVSGQAWKHWFVYSDASYEQSQKTGGLGAVLVNSQGQCVSWFGVKLGIETCETSGSKAKKTIIYELEMAAAVLATFVWKNELANSLISFYGDNDSVRFAFVRASAIGVWAQGLLAFYLKQECDSNTRSWFSRVPTEANISDYPSRSVSHPFLTEHLDASMKAQSDNLRLILYLEEWCAAHVPV